jgi:hypothetical protein
MTNISPQFQPLKQAETFANINPFDKEGETKPTDGKDNAKKTAHYLELFRNSIVDPTLEIEADQACLWINGKTENSVIGTLGNFSLYVGKAKSRKTFLIVAALAAICKGGASLAFRGWLNSNKNKAIFFDTEQSQYHVLKTIKRVCSLTGINVPLNFIGSGLRKYPPAERLAIIEAAIYNTPGLGFVVIDGIRDLVTAINDEPQATMITSCLLRWTEELKIHIIVVLHQNKTDKNPRGVIGTELINKAETVLSVTKDEKNKDISIVDAEYCRDKEPESFAFEIQADGLPYLVDDWKLKTERAGNPKAITPDEIDTDIHLKVLKEVFKSEPKPLAGVLYSNLQLQFKLLYDLKISDNKIVQFVTFYKQEGMITVNETKTLRDRYHILSDNQHNRSYFDTLK